MLAGGGSRRMGRDKLLLEVGGVPLLRRVCESLASACDEVLVVGESGAAARPEGARHVKGERLGGQGPLAGIEAGLGAAKNRLVFVAAGDMPFLSTGLIRHLLLRLGEAGACAAVPRYRGGTHPLCAAYDRGILPAVGSALDEGTRSVRGLLDGLPRVEYVGEDDLVRFGDPDLFLINVNSPEDLERARRAAPS